MTAPNVTALEARVKKLEKTVALLAMRLSDHLYVSQERAQEDFDLADAVAKIWEHRIPDESADAALAEWEKARGGEGARLRAQFHNEKV